MVEIQCNAGIGKWGPCENTKGLYKMQKQNCQSIITTLDTIAENRLLIDGEREQLETAWDNMAKLLCEEELKFYQRAKATDVLLGDNNTRYF